MISHRCPSTASRLKYRWFRQVGRMSQGIWSYIFERTTCKTKKTGGVTTLWWNLGNWVVKMGGEWYWLRNMSIGGLWYLMMFIYCILTIVTSFIAWNVISSVASIIISSSCWPYLFGVIFRFITSVINII